MRSFFDLVGFEYKKILKRKSAVIALAIVTAALCARPLTVFLGSAYIDGKPFESHYQAIVKDGAYARTLSGRAIDETLIAETKDAYSKVPVVERYSATPEYQQYARPYSGIFRIMYAVYNPAGSDIGGVDLDMEVLRNLSEEDMRDFYHIRHDSVAAGLRASAISDAAKEKLIELDSEIKTPFVFAYTDGFDSLMGDINTIGIACAFVLAVCLAPMFAGEYSTGADQLILSSKLGKNKLITAKLFTAISLCVVYFMFLLIMSFMSSMSVYGYDGANAPFQLLMPLAVYPLTILEAVLIFTFCAFLGTLLVVALTLLLSSKFKSPFGVIVIISVLLFMPTMVYVESATSVWPYYIFSLFPSNMMLVGSVFSHIPFDFFAFVVPPYVLLPVYAILVSALTLPITRRAFRNHQIG